MLLKLLHFLLFEIFYIVLDSDLMISISHLQLAYIVVTMIKLLLL